MSIIRSPLTSSIALSQARSTSLLPFLYQTPTLLAQPSPRPCTRLWKHRRYSRRVQSIPQAHLHADPTRRHYSNVFEDIVLAGRKSDTTSNPSLPIEEVTPESGADKATSKASTITSSEQAVFDLLYKDINFAASDSEKDENLLHEKADEYSYGYKNLNKIFDTAIRQLQEKETIRADKAAELQTRPPTPHPFAIDQAIVVDDESFPKGTALLQPLKLANGVVLGAETDWKKNEKRLRRACEDHKAMIMDRLERTTSDVEIWAVLEEEVFQLVKDLYIQRGEGEKERKTQLKEDKKARRRLKKNDTDDTAKNVDTRSNSSISEKDSDKALEISTSTALPTTTLITIFQSNYADYLLLGLRLFRRHYPASPYAPSLLPTVKRLGSISYVIGATPSLYNETLFIKWTQFSDLHGMTDLMQEMINQGIEWNEVTMVLLRRIARRRREALEGLWGVTSEKWWKMRANVEGWSRLWRLYEGMRRERRERTEKEALLENKAIERPSDEGSDEGYDEKSDDVR